MNPKPNLLRVIFLLVLIMALGFSAFSCLGEPTASKQPNLLLISVDTLRHDRLGFAGYPVPTSPNLDELARDATIFTNAFSQSGWTLPSMATIMTGRYPKQHGAIDFYRQIDATRPTLATILRGRGYDTRAFVSHVLLSQRYGFDRGFSQFDTRVLELGPPRDISTAGPLTDRAIGAFEESREPFFLWVHYFDPHFAYQSHETWASFGESPSDRHNQEIASTDFQIGRLLDALEASGRSDHTIVIFTSDHGEEFGEHGGKYHYTLYDEVVRIPLLLRVPGAAARKEDRNVQQIDLLPTVLSLLDIEAPIGLPGRHLLTLDDSPRKIFIERHRPAGFKQRAVIRGDRKLVRVEAVDLTSLPVQTRNNYTPVENVVVGTRLFDRSTDPGEHEDIFSADSGPDLELLRSLAEHFGGQELAPEDVDIDEALREALRALGYLR